jgi:hypothetical protein
MTRVWASVPTPAAWQNVTVTDSSYKQTLTGKEYQCTESKIFDL